MTEASIIIYYLLFIILSYFHHHLIISYIYSTININLDDKGLGQQIQLHNSLDAGFCQE